MSAKTTAAQSKVERSNASLIAATLFSPPMDRFIVVTLYYYCCLPITTIYRVIVQSSHSIFTIHQILAVSPFAKKKEALFYSDSLLY
jgi:hypothetical protein